MDRKIDREVLVEQDLAWLKQALMGSNSIEKKIEIVAQFPPAENFLSANSSLKELISTLQDKEKFVLYTVLALGQGQRVFNSEAQLGREDLQRLTQSLIAVEDFYQEIGGIVGYHLTCLELLVKKNHRKGSYYTPKAIDISIENGSSLKAVISAIQHLDRLAEIYPLGGAADRLSLNREEADIFQIAATLEFCEKTLLEHLIEDLQAREFLHFKLFGNQICVPIVLMTSDEKRGSVQVQKVFSEMNWFGRKHEDFFIFSQPLVPAMDKEGLWIVTGLGQLLFKPGGHGVIWKLAKESGALEWLKEKGKDKALTRQINNLVASVDYGLLAFLGIGFDQGKDFGFASCPSAKGVSEGVNVLIESEKGCCLTNIEYCDFTCEIENYNACLANTNLLFVDIETVEELIKTCPIPGMLVNAKKMKYKDSAGTMQETEVLRLESTMQNLADALVEPGCLQRSYITTNKRNKTISTIKKEFAFGSSMLQTPEQCYIDLLENGRDLLVNYCNFQVPKLNDQLSFFQNGPSFIFLYHPALGPLYHIIQQKINRGRLAVGSELKLQISEIFLQDLDIDGSLQIASDAIMGHPDENGIIQYSERTGKCILKNVRVRNSGINRLASRSFWKDEIVHKEKCEIYIEEGGEFYAENVLFRGEVQIRVPKGMKVTARMNNGHLELIEEVLPTPSWWWKYQIDTQDRISITAVPACVPGK